MLLSHARILVEFIARENVYENYNKIKSVYFPTLCKLARTIEHLLCSTRDLNKC